MGRGETGVRSRESGGNAADSTSEAGMRSVERIQNPQPKARNPNSPIQNRQSKIQNGIEVEPLPTFAKRSAIVIHHRSLRVSLFLSLSFA